MVLAGVGFIGYFCKVMNGRRLYLPVVLMLLAIVAVATFQVYWLIKTFREEKQELTFRANVLFGEALQRMRVEKLKLDTNFKDDVKFRVAGYGAVHMMDAMRKRAIDSFGHDKKFRVFVTSKNAEIVHKGLRMDSMNEIHVFKDGPGPGIISVLSKVDSLQDSISVKELSAKYAQILKEEDLSLPFFITSRKAVLHEEMPPAPFEMQNEITIGINNPVTYRLEIPNTNAFVLRKMWSQLLVSLLLVGLTIFSFALLLRSLVQQRKLTRIKNDFISNITHELKTPIATVSVAIEALRNFDALHDPEKTKEYLAISSNELQRLSFLVDKVLKLSMFEKHQVELKEETIDLAVLVKEVVKKWLTP
jgi:two-component system, OmpR family, phosphate regulon sensor histidine kinase PhoR